MKTKNIKEYKKFKMCYILHIVFVIIAFIIIFSFSFWLLHFGILRYLNGLLDKESLIFYFVLWFLVVFLSIIGLIFYILMIIDIKNYLFKSEFLEKWNNNEKIIQIGKLGKGRKLKNELKKEDDK